jgi:hypothetical protein
MTSATNQARKLLKQNSIMARWIGADQMEIWHCIELSLTALNYRASATCHKYIPITIMYDGKTKDAFLDPETRIVSATSAVADCDMYRYQYLEVNEEMHLKIDTLHGTATKVEESEIYVMQDTMALKHEWPITTFHAWHLYNDSIEEFFGHVDELTRMQKWQTTTEERKTARALVLGALPGGVEGYIENWFWSRLYFIRSRWIEIACGWATWLLLRDFIGPIAMAQCCMPFYTSFRAIIGKPLPVKSDDESDSDEEEAKAKKKKKKLAKAKRQRDEEQKAKERKNTSFEEERLKPETPPQSPKPSKASALSMNLKRQIVTFKNSTDEENNKKTQRTGKAASPGLSRSD